MVSMSTFKDENPRGNGNRHESGVGVIFEEPEVEDREMGVHRLRCGVM